MKSTVIRFGELYDIPSSNGLSRPSSVRGVGYKMINMGELFANDIVSDIDMERVLMSDKEKEKFLVNQGDLLFARQSLVASGAGKCSIVKDVKEPTTFESHLIRVRLNQDKANPWFYYYLFKLQNNPIKGIVNQCAQAGIRGNELLKVKVPYIAKTEQDKIVDVLYDYDQAIENNNKRIKILEQMAENLYKEWFVRFRFPGHENVEFDDAKPTNWKLLRLEDFGILLESGSRPSGGIDDAIEDGVPSLGAEAVNGLAEFDYSSVKLVPHEFYEKLKRGKNKGNHILVYKDGAYIGKVTIFRNEFPYKEYAINEHVFFLNSVDSEYQNYIYFTLNQDAYYITMQNLNRNAAQPGLSKPDVNRIKILVPEKRIIKKFNEIVEPIFEEVFKIAKCNSYLAKQRDLLLPRLMSGKLEVK